MVIKSCSKVAPKFYCKNCDYCTSKKSSYDKHLLTSKHSMVTNSCLNVAINFSCDKCKYTTNKKSSYDKHIFTAKHILMVKSCDSVVPKICYDCECGNKYMYYSGLSRHKKSCSINNMTLEKEKEKVLAPDISCNNTELIIELIKQNNEFKGLLAEQNHEFRELLMDQNKQNIELQKQLLEIAKDGKYITNNNKFNLNFFLNEQCKDAMNITDFVNSLQLQLADLEKVGELGYAAGISKIFINGLKQLDVFKRPIHCSDIKRETMYVKDKDAWEKENQEKEKMMWAIKNIAHKNVKQIPEWQEENPEYKNGESEINGQFLKIVNESMGGYNEEEDVKNYNKIIKNVAKEVAIER